MTSPHSTRSTASEPNGTEAVLLFDIDGTLLDARGAGRRAVEQAVQDWSGRSLGSFRVDLGGRTDLDIFRELVRELGLPYPSPPERRTVLRRYLDLLETELSRTPPHVYPGVEALIDRVARKKRLHLGLVTGNARPGAERKLAAAHLDRHFRFGAFGNDHEDRNHLVPLALRRLSRRYGRAFLPERAVVIGDTQNDIDCARAAGSPVLVVGTGFGDFDHLAPQADAALADLSDTEMVVQVLGDLVPGLPI